MKSFSGALFWTASSTLIKVILGLATLKLLAIFFGAEGIGRAANFMTLLTVLSVFAGGGIYNGVTKYVSEYEHQEDKLQSLLSTSVVIVFTFSFLLAGIFIFFADIISEFLFEEQAYSSVIIALAICQFGIAYGNLLLAILKGLRYAKYNALSMIIGAISGFLCFIVLLFITPDSQRFSFALVGLALMSAFVWLPAQWFITHYFMQKSGGNIKKILILFNFKWDAEQARHLAKFSVMVLVTTATLPVTYIFMRNILEQFHGIQIVGLWQAVTKISDAYLQFVTAAFSVYLLPTFARLYSFNLLKRELYKTLLFVFAIVSVSSLIVYLCRTIIINILFTDEFLAIQDQLIWQLIGDIFKVCAYVFGYLIIAKAQLTLYVLAEMIQASLLLVISILLIPEFGMLGAVQSYMWTYIIYFFCCLLSFKFYSLKKSKIKNA